MGRSESKVEDQTVNHPILGELDEAEGGGWSLKLALPAFQPLYERWYNDGGERQDTRDADEKAGRFGVILPPGPVEAPGRLGLQPPSDAQVAAVEYLRSNQERVAEAVKAALVEQAPAVFHWEYIEDSLSDEMKAKLATPDGMMQAVKLQSIVIGVGDHDGLAKVGFSFHSEILEPEHGVCVVVLRETPVLVGTWDELMDIERPDDDDFGYDDEIEGD
jgi:hypothetical protein